MADFTLPDGNVLLSTSNNRTANYGVSRADNSATNPLAQISMFGSGTNNFQGVVAFGTINSGLLTGTLIERMRIHTNGYVGIGTTTPAAPLDVSGYLHVSGNTNPSTPSQGGYLGWNALTGGTGETDFINNQGLGSGGFAFMNTPSSGSPRTTLMYITGGGNVGIGTTTPQAKLDVIGAIRAGSSDIYFTEPNHNHTGIGNTTGFAAIENASNYGALMILGRSTPQGRIVKLWDRLEVNGSQMVTGRIGTNNYNPDSGYPGGWGGGVHTWDVYAEGSVGCGQNGNCNVYISQNGAANKSTGIFWGSLSDKRLKKNIKPLKESLNKLLKLRGTTYEWKEPEKFGNVTGERMGLVAQEVEEIFPEWVETLPDGNKAVNPVGLEALIIESFKELKALYEQLSAKNDEFESRIKALEKKVKPAGT